MGFILVQASEEYYPTSSVELSCSRARVFCSRGYKLVGRECWTQVPWNGVRSVGGLTLVTVALLPLLWTKGEGHKGKGNMRYSAWSLGCPVVRHCPSGHIKAEPHYMVLGAAVWLGEALHPGTLGASSE
jgi:hypothetical protein